MRPARLPQLPTLHLQRGEPQTLEQQLVQGLRDAILAGTLPAGSRLASQRQLAREYGVGRNVVVSALETLQAEGYLVTSHGSGTFVADGAVLPEPSGRVLGGGRWLRSVPAAEVDPPASTTLLEFRVCQPSVALLDLQDWQASVRQAARESLSEDYLDPQGLWLLREEVARYLGRSRGIACTAGEVLITAGALQAIDLVAQAVLSPGDPVAFEDPGYRLARQVLSWRGARLHSIPVDQDGLQLAPLQALPDAPLLAYVTPSHQFPLGGRMALSRRLALLEWAEQHDSLILEDDYDSEFRYDAPPLPALASLDRQGRVVYVGTFSKVLSPALRLGYVVATPVLLEQLLRLKHLSDYHTPALTQQTLAHFMASGALDRHIKKMRRIYAEKRQQLQALHGCVPGVQLQGLEAGLHALLALPPHLDAAEVVRACLERQVLVQAASRYSVAREVNGLVLGYGHLSLPRIQQGVQVLIKVLRQQHALRYTACP